MRPRLILAVVVGLVALFATKAVAPFLGSTTNDWFMFLTVVAGFVGPLLAVALWRRQSKAQSDHDLAKRVAADVFRVREVRLADATLLRSLAEENMTHSDVAQMVISQHESNAERVAALFERVACYGADVHVAWGPYVLRALDAIHENARGIRAAAYSTATGEFANTFMTLPTGNPMVYARPGFAAYAGGMEQVLLNFLLAQTGRREFPPVSVSELNRQLCQVEIAAYETAGVEFEQTIEALNTVDPRPYEAWCDHQARFDAVALPTETN